MDTNKTKATLDKKSISAIADQVEARMRQAPANTVPKAQDSKDGHGGKSVFFWGAASGLALAFAAPLVGRQAKPLVKGAIKGGIAAGRYVQKVSSTVKEDVQDLAAEARADLNSENDNGQGQAKP
jgi:hypothetical protein